MLLTTFEVVLVGGPLDGKAWRVSGDSDTIFVKIESKNARAKPFVYVEYKRGTGGTYRYVGKAK